MPFTDLFLYDVKCMNRERHKKYVGASNELILENLARLLDDGAKVIIRIPTVSGVNDFTEDMTALRDFLNAHGGAESVELLPYHAMGEHKYAAIGKSAATFAPPTDERLSELRKIFE